MTDDERDAVIEDWTERAAIMEFEAGMPRSNAESMALRDLVESRGKEAGRAVQSWRKCRCESYAAKVSSARDSV